MKKIFISCHQVANCYSNSNEECLYTYRATSYKSLERSTVLETYKCEIIFVMNKIALGLVGS